MRCGLEVFRGHVLRNFRQQKNIGTGAKCSMKWQVQLTAVMVATADHSHALIAATCFDLGKHVYCQKPLTHSVYESRLLTKLAAKYKVATQMGNQGNSGDGVRQLCEWIWNNEIGEIREVHAWTDRPIWPQGVYRDPQSNAGTQNS
jgi:predicted dehydrogenase